MWIEKHGRTWRIRDLVGGRKVTIRSGYSTKSAAGAAMTLASADKMRGDGLLPQGGKVTLSEFLNTWWPSYTRSLKPSTQHSETARVHNHIRPLLGSFRLDDLSTAVVQRWIADLEAGRGPMGEGTSRPRRPLAPKTVHNAHGLLFVILDAAVAAHRIRTNPCAATRLPARVRREMRFLTDPEIGRLLKATPEHWRPLVLLLVTTGLRWSEAIGLQVGRVDLFAAKPKLLVLEQMQELPTGELVFVAPKTVNSRRTVTFTKQVAMTLTGLMVDRGFDDLVFLTPTGRPVRTRNFRRVWVKACERAGLAGLRVHDLRHTHAAILMSAGESLFVISRRLGHSSTVVTELLYGHLRTEADEGVLKAIEEALAGIDPAVLAAEVDEECADVLAGDPDGEMVGETAWPQMSSDATG